MRLVGFVLSLSLVVTGCAAGSSATELPSPKPSVTGGASDSPAPDQVPADVCRALKAAGHLATVDDLTLRLQGSHYVSAARRWLDAIAPSDSGYDDVVRLVSDALDEYETALAAVEDAEDDTPLPAHVGRRALLEAAARVGEGCGHLFFVPAAPTTRPSPAPRPDVDGAFAACLIVQEAELHTIKRVLEDCEPLRPRTITPQVACAIVVDLRYYERLGYSRAETATEVVNQCVG